MHILGKLLKENIKNIMTLLIFFDFRKLIYFIPQFHIEKIRYNSNQIKINQNYDYNNKI